MPSPISVFIHTVGIVLFSSQVPNDCGLKALVPLVAYTNPYTDPRIARAASSSFQAGSSAKMATTPARWDHPIGPAPHVEDHVALLVFPATEYITNTNWSTPITLPGDPTYKYVKLDGERIRFETGLPNQASSLANLKLPSLHALCPSMHSLNANFQPPYFGAAAVFDLPQGNVNACLIPNKRIDTEIGLQSSGILTISASTMRVRKEIQLKPDSSGTIKLIVANVPVSCLTNGYCSAPNPSAINGVSHVHAYYAMGDGQMAGMNITDWVSSANQMPTNQCVVSIPNAAGGFGMAGKTKNGNPDPMGADFECSNSAWP
jgi:hypothetical protein